MIAKNQQINTLIMNDKITDLCHSNKQHNNQNTVQLLKDIVPEYKSNNSIYEKLDIVTKK